MIPREQPVAGVNGRGFEPGEIQAAIMSLRNGQLGVYEEENVDDLQHFLSVWVLCLISVYCSLSNFSLAACCRKGGVKPSSHYAACGRSSIDPSYDR